MVFLGLKQAEETHYYGSIVGLIILKLPFLSCQMGIRIFHSLGGEWNKIPMLLSMVLSFLDAGIMHWELGMFHSWFQVLKI